MNPLLYGGFIVVKHMSKNIHAVALGRAGGLSTMRKHGRDHYRKLAEHMNKVRAMKKKPL